MKVHILGNGPSVAHFDYSPGIRIGCNFPRKAHAVNFISVTDYPVFRQGVKEDRFYAPLILSSRVTTKVRRPRGNVEAVVPHVHFREFHPSWGINAGHQAVIYARDFATEYHLWGVDSFWRNMLNSYTDNYVEKNCEQMIASGIHIVWRKYWLYLFETISAKFYVHTSTEVLEW